MITDKWCPFVRVSEDEGVKNRDCGSGKIIDFIGRGRKWNSCIEEDCAMWSLFNKGCGLKATK
jgi:hypothetical protein